ncbi:cupin domain-containing protein [Roseiarcaceae bacterium H3SJ34-1]|uniref:cupin domain-containing protein n=1 Tax=Terripilifer ovatus TaxID=3032367 RepID=UPI003AB953E4|nr:cupin domain-containing protein [Roseiarcaceae bacterium H3SJ34-1]
MNAHAQIAAPAEVITWLDSTYKILLTTAETRGRAGMFESIGEPNTGPPRHIHHREDEIIYICEGEALFWVEGRTFLRQAGAVVFVPRGKEHAFRVTGDGPARFLATLTPGGFEGFFPAVARNALKVPEDMPDICRIAGDFNCEFTGPPLA